MKKPMYAEDVFKKKRLIIYPGYFACPYCARTVNRGGHAEGFRKSGMSNHVYVCWEIGVYLRGYLIGEWMRGAGKQRAVPVEGAPDWGKKFVRSIKARMRQRAKDGELGALQP